MKCKSDKRGQLRHGKGGQGKGKKGEEAEGRLGCLP